MIIYHYNSATSSFDKHSSFFCQSIVTSNDFKLDYEGLNLIIYTTDNIGYYLNIYRRNIISD